MSLYTVKIAIDTIEAIHIQMLQNAISEHWKYNWLWVLDEYDNEPLYCLEGAAEVELGYMKGESHIKWMQEEASSIASFVRNHYKHPHLTLVSVTSTNATMPTDDLPLGESYVAVFPSY